MTIMSLYIDRRNTDMSRDNGRLHEIVCFGHWNSDVKRMRHGHVWYNQLMTIMSLRIDWQVAEVYRGCRSCIGASGGTGFSFCH